MYDGGLTYKGPVGPSTSVSATTNPFAIDVKFLTAPTPLVSAVCGADDDHVLDAQSYVV